MGNNVRMTFPTFTFFSGIALTIGLMVPTFFEWLQPRHAQSRMPSMEAGAIAVLAITLLACGLLIMWGKPPKEPQRPPEAKPQFGLRQMFLFVTWAAGCLAAGVWLDSSALVAAVALGIAAWSLFQGPAVRSRMGALLASMFFPFAWMIAFNVPLGRTSGLARHVPISPGAIPAEFLRSFVIDMKVDDSSIVTAGLVVVQLLLGAWLMRRGGKLAAAYLLFSLISASLGSLAVHALYRM